MKITPAQRRTGLIAIAAGLAVLAILDGEEAEPNAVSAASVPRMQAGSERLPEIAFDKLEVKIAREPVSDAFEVRSWDPPVPKKKALPPPLPQAPPLPYTYVGKIIEDNQVTVFLAKQSRNYVVKQSETLDGTYRVDEIRDGTMTLTYLPLDKKQTLAIGAVN